MPAIQKPQTPVKKFKIKHNDLAKSQPHPSGLLKKDDLSDQDFTDSDDSSGNFKHTMRKEI
jgi:hypothetical protein